ncbi:uncharacterized protein LOC124434176 [Xenia sp. Carnegie-2017]|uniref:uncharacterized protein LOC124434176 n=1 Tax=Xenia sp. Carnegie-2017 TaxID=2897299 RepID=UPI001F03E644|nr:uncharacterized protein LOC124434176 [Xenia sp. Carnegie-2017]
MFPREKLGRVLTTEILGSVMQKILVVELYVNLREGSAVKVFMGVTVFPVRVLSAIHVLETESAPVRLVSVSAIFALQELLASFAKTTERLDWSVKEIALVFMAPATTALRATVFVFPVLVKEGTAERIVGLSLNLAMVHLVAVLSFLCVMRMDDATFRILSRPVYACLDTGKSAAQVVTK